jgi:iron complex outermembrane receptor protein
MLLPQTGQAQVAEAGFQDDTDSGGSDIVVTARKRSERLIDVPMAVTSLGADQLSVQNIRETADLIGRVPGLSVSQTNTGQPAGEFGSIVIRGVGFNGGLEPAVGVFLDGLYQPGLGFNADFADAERVEVLRGPQGTLFGRNTQGGVLNIVTRRPGPLARFSGEVELAERGVFNARGSISGPLADSFFGGFSATVKNSNGYLDNQTLGRPQDDVRSWGIRGALGWEADNGLRVDLTGDFSSKSFGSQGVGVPQGCNCYTTFNEFAPGDRLKTSGVLMTVVWDMGGVTLTSLTGARWINLKEHVDQDGVASDPTPFVNDFGETIVGNRTYLDLDQHIYSQELRLTSNGDGPLSWIFGLYGFQEKHEQSRFLGLGDVSSFVNKALLGTTVRERIRLGRIGGAAFGQMTAKLGGVELSAGLRYGVERADISGDRRRDIPAIPAARLIFSPDAEETFRNLTPMASVSYALAENAKIYATASRGWKAGGFQKYPATAADANTPFGSELSTNYEIGVKANLAGVAQINAAIFYIDLKNQQLRSLVVINSIPTSTVNNIGSSHTQGAEFEATVHATDRLILSGSLAYTDTAFDSYVDQNKVDRKGDAFDYVPRWTASFDVVYKAPVSASWDLEARANYQHVGRYTVENSNRPGTSLPIDSRNRVNASLALKRDRLTLTAYVENLFDSYDVVNITASGFSSAVNGPYFDQPLAPRTFGVKAALSF